MCAKINVLLLVITTDYKMTMGPIHQNVWLIKLHQPIIRYKAGKSSSFVVKDVLVINKPKEANLPQSNVSTHAMFSPKKGEKRQIPCMSEQL